MTSVTRLPSNLFPSLILLLLFILFYYIVLMFSTQLWLFYK